MSPSDPISPTSPSSICSEFSPVESIEDRHFAPQPITPILTPSLSAPCLVTSFNVNGNANNRRRLSTRSLLSNLSPLELVSTSVNASDCSPDVENEISDWIHLQRSSYPDRYELDSIQSENEQRFSVGSGSAIYSSTSLGRESAIDGLEAMVNSITTFRAERNDDLWPCVSLDDQIPGSSDNSYNDTNEPLHAIDRSHTRLTINQAAHRSKRAEAPLPPFLYIKKPSPIQASIDHLRTTLVPLVSVKTGRAHPDFPRSILQYHLLTHNQLDSLALWYHQFHDAGKERWDYPAPIADGKSWVSSSQSSRGDGEEELQVDLNTKRRRWGRFIGLRGCKSPNGCDEYETDTKPDTEVEGEDVTLVMERKWRDGLRKQEEDYELLQKLGRDRF